MDDDIDDNCDGATGDNNDDDATDDNGDDDGNGVMDDYVNDDDGDCTTDDGVDDDGYGAMDDDIDNDCDGATDGRHRLEACGGCATKSDARRRHTTTGDLTTSQRTRCKWEERRQRTRVDRASIGRGCA